MIYKIIAFFVAILLYVDCNAQQAIFPASHRMTVYLDNIIVSNIIFGNEHMVNCGKIPLVLREHYYGKDCIRIIEMKKNIYLEKNTTYNKNNLHIRTKKAKTGYLYINECLMDYIKQQNYDTEYLKVVYVLNNMPVSSENNVVKLLKLSKRKVKRVEFKNDSDNKIVEVLITLK